MVLDVEAHDLAGHRGGQEVSASVVLRPNTTTSSGRAPRNAPTVSRAASSTPVHTCEA